MKTYPLYITLISLFVVLCLASCTSNEEKATKAAYNYSFAMANYDLDKAEKYATQETCDNTIAMARDMLEYVDSSYIASDTPATLEVTATIMTSDTSATVSFIKNTPIKKDMKFNVEVRKRHGKWLAHNPINRNQQKPTAGQKIPQIKFSVPLDSASSR